MCRQQATHTIWDLGRSQNLHAKQPCHAGSDSAKMLSESSTRSGLAKDWNCARVTLLHHRIPTRLHRRSTSSLRRRRDPPAPMWIATRRRTFEPRPRPLLEALMSAFTAATMPFTSAHAHVSACQANPALLSSLVCP